MEPADRTPWMTSLLCLQVQATFPSPGSDSSPCVIKPHFILGHGISKVIVSKLPIRVHVVASGALVQGTCTYEPDACVVSFVPRTPFNPATR